MSNLPVFDQFLNRTKLASIPPSHCRYDVDKSSFIDLMELKLMMEKLNYLGNLFIEYLMVEEMFDC